jgi:16S rRNA (guanine527-N7)-methyltransferase
VEDRLRAGARPNGIRLLPAVTGAEDFAAAFDVPRETIGKLTRYAELLEAGQSHTNLIAKSTMPEIWDRHFADSAQLLGLAPAARVWLDLGSGAGFPGLVIAILGANHASFLVHLVESTAKKCAFLAEVARQTEAPVEIHCMRVEELERGDKSLDPEVVSARALAPLPRLLELAAPWLRQGSKGLFLKGRDLANEIHDAERRFRFKAIMHPSLTSAESTILEVADLGMRGKRGAK